MLLFWVILHLFQMAQIFLTLILFMCLALFCYCILLLDYTMQYPKFKNVDNILLNMFYSVNYTWSQWRQYNFENYRQLDHF